MSSHVLRPPASPAETHSAVKGGASGDSVTIAPAPAEPPEVAASPELTPADDPAFFPEDEDASPWDPHEMRTPSKATRTPTVVRTMGKCQVTACLARPHRPGTRARARSPIETPGALLRPERRPISPNATNRDSGR